MFGRVVCLRRDVCDHLRYETDEEYGRHYPVGLLEDCQSQSGPNTSYAQSEALLLLRFWRSVRAFRGMLVGKMVPVVVV